MSRRLSSFDAFSNVRVANSSPSFSYSLSPSANGQNALNGRNPPSRPFLRMSHVLFLLALTLQVYLFKRYEAALMAGAGLTSLAVQQQAQVQVQPLQDKQQAKVEEMAQKIEQHQGGKGEEGEGGGSHRDLLGSGSAAKDSSASKSKPSEGSSSSSTSGKALGAGSSSSEGGREQQAGGGGGGRESIKAGSEHTSGSSSEHVVMPEAKAVPCHLAKMGGRAVDDYGAWTLCLNQVRPHGIVYSFGIGNDLSFDNAMVERGYQVFAFDPTVDDTHIANLFRKNHNKAVPSGFHFRQIGLSDTDGVVTFRRSSNKKVQSMSAIHDPKFVARYVDSGALMAPVLRLQTLMASLNHKYVDVVKMDVEGLELGVCAQIYSISKKQPVPYGQMLIEFHDRMFEKGRKRRGVCLRALASSNYTLVYKSENEQELTFSRTTPHPESLVAAS